MAPATNPVVLKELTWLGGIGGIGALAVFDILGSILSLLAVGVACCVSYFRLLIVLDERRRARDEAGDK